MHEDCSGCRSKWRPYIIQMIYVHTKIIRLSFICISSCEGEDLEKNNVKNSTPGNTACVNQRKSEKAH